MATAVTALRTQSPSQVSRDASLDRVRIIGMLAVVLIHVSAPPNEAFGRVGERTWMLSTVISVATHWAVPVFVMASGAVLLDLRTATQEIGSFYRRRAVRVGIPLVVWTAFYYGYRFYLDQPPQGARQVASELLSAAPFYHLYFMFLICGLYVVAPFLARAVAPMRTAELGRFAVAAILVGMVIQGAPRLGLPGGVNTWTYWVPYVGFFLAGAWLVRIRITARLRCIAGLVALGSVVISSWGMLEMVRAHGVQNGRYLAEQFSPTMVALSLAMFVLLRWSGDGGAGRLWTSWSARTLTAISFGVYLLHPLFLTEWQERGNSPPSDGPGTAWWLVETYAVVLGLAVLSAYLISRIPILRRTI
jgi:surface polysaccharide O-acyltransferase-like enzyme